MAGQLTIDTLKASTGVLATQNGMTGIAKAWVNFAGSSGTVNSSFNVSSVTRNSTGNYTVNLTTAMTDTNYSTNISATYPTANNFSASCFVAQGGTYTASAVQIATSNSNNSIAFYDPTKVFVLIFGA